MTLQEEKDFFADTGVDYDKLSDQEKAFFKDTMMFKTYALGVEVNKLKGETKRVALKLINKVLLGR
jgi:hypothetical protein